MTLDDVAAEAEDFLRELTGRPRPVVDPDTGFIPGAPRRARTPQRELVARLLSLAGRGPDWQILRSTGSIAHPSERHYDAVTLQLKSAPLEARGDLVSCAVLLAVELYDRRPRGRCPVRLRALASLVASEDHARLTSPVGP